LGSLSLEGICQTIWTKQSTLVNSQKIVAQHDIRYATNQVSSPSQRSSIILQAQTSRISTISSFSIAAQLTLGVATDLNVMALSLQPFLQESGAVPKTLFRSTDLRVKKSKATNSQ
jgi:hypothetical protein